MSMKDLVHNARTCRRFVQSDRIPLEVLRSLVDLARIVPQGGNRQNLRYRIISDPEECADVFPYTAWAGLLKDWPGPAEGERPTGYIIILKDGVQDVNVGIASQTIQLAAEEMGYGACMLGSLKRDKIQAVLKIPDPYKIMLVLALGRRAEKAVLEDVSKDRSLDYYRTPDGVHHVPKLRLEDVLL